MPTFRNELNGDIVTTDRPDQVRRFTHLRNWRELPGTFDPADHTVPEVLDHLRDASSDEVDRVLALEADGKARAGVLDHSPARDDSAGG